MSDLNLKNKNEDDSNPHGFKKDGRLDEIRKKLYSTHYEPTSQRAKLKNKRYDLEDKWEGEDDLDIEKIDTEGDYWGPYAQNEEKKSKKTTNGFFLLLISAVMFFIGSLGYAYYSFYVRNPGRGQDVVGLNITGPMSVGGGDTLSFDVIIQNNFSGRLELVDLVIDYPPGTRDPFDLSREMRRDRMGLADIEPGAINRKNVSAVLFGDENSVQDITVTLEYRLQGSSAIFQRRNEFSVTLSASPVRLAVTGLRELASGQGIELKAVLSSNSTRELKDIMVTADYPFGFTFENSNINPYADNNVWLFPTLAPGEEKEILIRGTILGQQNDERVFRFNTGIKSEEEPDQIGIVWNTTLHETRIEDGSGNLAFVLNGDFTNELVIQNASDVNAMVIFYNNTDDTIRNIEVKVDLEGELINQRTVRARDGGFYDSNTNTITWTEGNNSRLRSLEAGDTLDLEFTFTALDFNTLEERIEDPKIIFNAEMKGVRISGDRVQENIVAQRPAVISILSNIRPSVYTKYGDNPLNNFGSIPPIVGQPTTYTLTFKIENGNNKLENAQFSTTLPSYVTWERVANPEGQRISYNENTRELVWNIGDLEPGVGENDDARKLYLSVTFLPSISQLNSTVDLTRNTRFRAFDTSAQENINLNIPEATTRLSGTSQSDSHSQVSE